MTAYRMARTLQGTGHLVHDPSIGGYRLGPAMLAGIYLAEGFAQLVDVARPYLESLVDRTGELGRDRRGARRCGGLRRPGASTRPFVPEIAVGKVIGDTANAHGKMFAAVKPDEERARVARRRHKRLTGNTIVDPEALAAELEQIRADGLAWEPRRARHGHLRGGGHLRDRTGGVERHPGESWFPPAASGRKTARCVPKRCGPRPPASRSTTGSRGRRRRPRCRQARTRPPDGPAREAREWLEEARIMRENDQDVVAVRALADRYVDAVYRADVGVLRECFHPAAVMSGYLGEDLLGQAAPNAPSRTWPPRPQSGLDWALLRRRGSPPRRSSAGPRACASTRPASSADSSFANWFHLIKGEDGAWSIVSKLFAVQNGGESD